MWCPAFVLNTHPSIIYVAIFISHRYFPRQTPYCVLTVCMYVILVFLFFNQNMMSYLINTTGLGLQSSFRLLLNWILHNSHDICGTKSVHFGDSSCF